MNTYALGTIVGTTLLGFAKARTGGRNYYKPEEIEDIYDLSAKQKAQITILDLPPKDLTYIPDNIFDGFTNLTHLYLWNKLKKLPQSIGNLTKLTMISLENNDLTELPEYFTNLTNLDWLDLRGNQLTELPESFGNLTKLKYIELTRNQLTKLPESFGNLTNLEVLWLGDNPLTELPQSIGNLTKLRELYLFKNNWKKPVPKEIILKMIRNRVNPPVIKKIIHLNNSIPTTNKSNLRLR